MSAEPKTLSPLMQEVADWRESVRRCEGEVEHCKSELKIAKAALEEAQGGLNKAIDTLVEAERQPSLFDTRTGEPVGAAEPTGSTPETPPPAEPPAAVAGEVIDATFTLVPGPTDRIPPGPVEGLSGVIALPALPAGPAWRALKVEEEIDGQPEVFDALAAHQVETLGQLADALALCQTFGLQLVDVAELEEVIEQVSADDPHPICFTRAEDGDEAAGDTEPEEVEVNAPGLFGRQTAGPGGIPTRDQFPADRLGKWEFLIATRRHFGNVDADDERLAAQVADYRARKAAGRGWDEWGQLSQFDVTATNAAGVGIKVDVLYIPGWKGNAAVDFLEMWGPLSQTNYWSDEVKHDKGKRPTRVPLSEWAREYAQRQADTFAKEQKRQARADRQKSGGGAEKKKASAKKGA